MINLRHQGYSLIEAVIAVGVLATVIATGLSIILTATGTEETNQDFLIANLLAQEGAERVKNIYYTNIVKYGAENVAECGFVEPTAPDDLDSDDCDDYLIEDGRYRLTGAYLLEWDLEPMGLGMYDGENLNEDYRLYNSEMCGDLGCTIDVQAYLPVPSGGTIPPIYNPTEFHREIVTSNVASGIVDVVSRVGWFREGGNVRTLEVSVSLPLNI